MIKGPVQREVVDGDAASTGGAAASDAYDAVRANEDIQYAPIEVEAPPEPPSWLADLLEAIGNFFAPIGQMFGASWPIVKWVLIAAGVTMLLYMLWRLLAPVLDLRPSSVEQAEEWVPEEQQAVALLEDADALAAQGRYDEATHLLLVRSVDQISTARPDWVDPSSTARELARLPYLPAGARATFSTIADSVERSLFALRKLGPEDWQTARSAYAEFALQNLTDTQAPPQVELTS